MVIERNIFGPDKRNRCFPIKNRKSAAIYVWGGYRWAGNNRITHNLIFGPCDRGISLNKCNFNLVANNVFLNCDGAPIQIGSGFGNVVVNNIIEYGIGGEETEAVQKRPSGYVFFAFEDPAPVALSLFRNNLLLPRGDLGKEIPDFITHSRLAAADPFVGRQNFDLRIKPDAEAVDLGMVVPHLSGEVKGQGPDAGAIELGEEIQGEKSRFPEIPKWLLDEWPPSRRGE
jgi:hypothetical protein